MRARDDAFRTACEQTLCGFTGVTEITRGVSTWLAGYRQDAHLGAIFGPEAAFLAGGGGTHHHAAVPQIFVTAFDGNDVRCS